MMAKEAHTPGPWEAIGTDPSEGVDCWWLVGADKRHVGTINGGQGDEVPQANAHLIEAAPEGLEIAEEFLAFARSGKAFSYPPGSLQKLEQFIAKARGEA